MKLFFIGGVSSHPASSDYVQEQSRLTAAAKQLGELVAQAGHEVILCSPFPDSFDLELLHGFASARDRAAGEIHFPDTPEITQKVHEVLDELGLANMRPYGHAAVHQPDGAFDRTHSWLLTQLIAMESSALIVAAGGKVGGSAEMLLHLAERRRHPILPLSCFGGAAAASFNRLRYVLGDMLKDHIRALQDQSSLHQLMAAVDKLTAGKSTSLSAEQLVPRFFISYSRERQADADAVETILRRRKLDVFRDERDFTPGQEIMAEIRNNLHRANIFIALWCRDYACSPWCHDELELALDRADEGTMALWLLRLDETRLVPPRIRKKIYHDCFTREQLTARIVELLEQQGQIS